MNKAEYDKLIHDCQTEMDKKSQPQMEELFNKTISEISNDDGGVNLFKAIHAAYYASAKVAIGVSADVTAQILVKLGIVTLEDA